MKINREAFIQCVDKVKNWSLSQKIFAKISAYSQKIKEMKKKHKIYTAIVSVIFIFAVVFLISTRFDATDRMGSSSSEPGFSTTAFPFYAFDSDIMVKLLQITKVGAIIDDDGDVRISTDAGQNIYVTRSETLKALRFSSVFFFKKNTALVSQQAFLAKIANDVCLYSNVEFGSDGSDALIVSRSIPMETGGITAGHFLESLGKFSQEVREIESIGKNAYFR